MVDPPEESSPQERSAASLTPSEATSPRSVSTRRSNVNNLETISGLDIFTLEKIAEDHFSGFLKTLKTLFPILAGCLWILVGAVFYTLEYDDISWPYGLLLSVNLGWSVGCTIPGDHMAMHMKNHDSSLIKSFNIFHTSLGVLFGSVVVLYVAEELGKNKDNWIIQIIKLKELDIANESKQSWNRMKGLLQVHHANLRIFVIYLICICFGLVWYEISNTDFSIIKNLDFLLSTVTAGGYVALPTYNRRYEVLVIALYTAIIVPLQNIVLGLVVSILIDSSSSQVEFDKIVAPVSKQKLNQIKDIGMDDGTGFIDCKTFIVMAAIRVGIASEGLVKKICDRFAQLDRRHTGRVAYKNIVARQTSNKGRDWSSSLKITKAQEGSALMNNIIRLFSEKVFRRSSQKVHVSQVDVARNIAKIEDLSCRENENSSCRRSFYTNYARKGAYESPAICALEKNESMDEGDIVDEGDDTNDNSETISQPSNLDDIESQDAGNDNNNSSTDIGADQQTGEVKCKLYVQLTSASNKKSTLSNKNLTDILASYARSTMTSLHARLLLLWFLWLLAGTVFYASEESVEFGEALYLSTSIGYGIFWYNLDSASLRARIYTKVHFLTGVMGVAIVMALIARRLVSNKNKQLESRISSEDAKDSSVFSKLITIKTVVCVHIFLAVWMVVGIVWGVASIGWSILDAWLFAVSTMATGGLVSLPSDGSVTDGDYVFVSIYIIVGAPLMAISCGIAARAISSKGRSLRMEKMLYAPVTEDELVMMRHLNVEDDDGYIDRGEFVILCLIRIGVMCSDLIDVLLDRFWDIDTERKGIVAAGELLYRPSFTRQTSSMSRAFQGDEEANRNVMSSLFKEEKEWGVRKIATHIKRVFPI